MKNLAKLLDIMKAYKLVDIKAARHYVLANIDKFDSNLVKFCKELEISLKAK